MDKIVRELFDGNSRTPKKWFFVEEHKKNERTTIRRQGRQKLNGFLNSYNIVVVDYWYDMSLEEFEEWWKSENGAASASTTSAPIEAAPAEPPVSPEPPVPAEPAGMLPTYETPKNIGVSKALKGTYQIFRLATDDEDSYIVEPLTIEEFDVHCGVIAHAYSYHQVKRDALYSGRILPDEKMCYAQLGRHHSDEGRFIGRCMIMQVLLEKAGRVYLSRDCFSGLMLRGTTGLILPQRGKAIPFFVIKLGCDVFDMKSISDRSDTKGRFVDIGGELLAGTIFPKDGKIFDLCQFVFRKLLALNTSEKKTKEKPKNNRFTLSTNLPGEVENAIIDWGSANMKIEGGPKELSVLDIWRFARGAH